MVEFKPLELPPLPRRRSPILGLSLVLLGLFLAAIAMACSALSKDTKAVGEDILDCSKAELARSALIIAVDVYEALANHDTAALQALGVKDGVDVLVCAAAGIKSDIMSHYAVPASGPALMSSIDLTVVDGANGVIQRSGKTVVGLP